LFGCAIFGRRLKRRPFQDQVTSVASQSRVFSCAIIVFAGRAQLLVQTGLLGVPVRVEDRVNRAVSGQARNGLHQRA
jgi:hypothetical protein